MKRRRRIRSWGAVLVAFVVVALSTASCRQLIDARSEEACGGRTSARAACASCASRNCCDEVVACRRDKGCAQLDDCLESCAGDGACRAACRDVNEVGAEAFPLIACQSSICGSECALPCGGYPFPSGGCSECAKTHCCDQATACGGNAECLALSACAWACAADDASCRGECLRAHESGQADARALAECLEVACADCFPPPSRLPPPDWTCVDEIPEPPPCGDAVGATILLRDFQTSAPFSGVFVRACLFDEADQDCVTPLDTAFTDADGFAFLDGIPCGASVYFRADGGGSPAEPEASLSVLKFRAYPVPDENFNQELQTISWLDYLELYSGIRPITPGAGHVYVDGAFDCQGLFGPGLSFTISPDAGTAYYGDHGEHPGPTTTEVAFGGFLNVPPGTYRIAATRDIEGTPTCVASADVFIRPNAETQIQLVPGLGGCK